MSEEKQPGQLFSEADGQRLAAFTTEQLARVFGDGPATIDLSLPSDRRYQKTTRPNISPPISPTNLYRAVNALQQGEAASRQFLSLDEYDAYAALANALSASIKPTTVENPDGSFTHTWAALSTELDVECEQALDACIQRCVEVTKAGTYECRLACDHDIEAFSSTGPVSPNVLIPIAGVLATLYRLSVAFVRERVFRRAGR